MSLSGLDYYPVAKESHQYYGLGFVMNCTPSLREDLLERVGAKAWKFLIILSCDEACHVANVLCLCIYCKHKVARDANGAIKLCLENLVTFMQIIQTFSTSTVVEHFLSKFKLIRMIVSVEQERDNRSGQK